MAKHIKVLNKSAQSSIGKTIKESAYNKNKHVYDNLKDQSIDKIKKM